MRTKLLLLACGLALPGAASAATLFRDGFDRPNGRMTSNADWEVTSGVLTIDGGAATTNSPVFRADTRRTDFGDVSVTMRVLNSGVRASGETYDGFHVMLRRRTQYHLYYCSINRRDGKIVVKKKTPGGPSNGGTYHNLTGLISYPVPYGQWQAIRATAQDNPNGSVTIRLWVNGVLRATAVDNGVGGAPIRGRGGVGIRGDNATLRVDDFEIADLEGSSASGAPGGSGTAAVADGRAPQRFLTPSRADGVNDAVTFGASAEQVEIFDQRGRQVFSRARNGAPIVWDCKDGSGQVVESGVYTAKVKSEGLGETYQSFVVVK